MKKSNLEQRIVFIMDLQFVKTKFFVTPIFGKVCSVKKAKIVEATMLEAEQLMCFVCP